MSNFVYVSTDIEADGPIPGPNSMLSFASVAYSPDGKERGSFSVNLTELPGASRDKATMEWWQTQPEAWARTQENQVAPQIAMANYKGWLLALRAKPIFVGYPATFDFMFVYWYLIRFAGESPFSFSAWDMKTAVAMALNKRFDRIGKKAMPKEWFDTARKHTHVALEDAREQGELHFKILKHANYAPEAKS